MHSKSTPRLSKRRKPLKRSGIKRKPRPAAKTNRIYGAPARRRFVLGLPCAACGVEGFSVQAHVAPPGEKGTGYKAGYEWIVPLCAPRPQFLQHEKTILGCHILHDVYPSVFAERYPEFDAAKAAQETEKAWLAHLEETK